MFDKIKKIFTNSVPSVSEITRETDEKIERAIPQVMIVGEDKDNITFDWDFLETKILEFDYDDESIVMNDPIVMSRLDKLLSDAQTYKEDFIWEGVSDEMRTFISNLNNSLDWGSFNRYVFTAVPRKYSVIQLLWRDVEYEMIAGVIYPAEQQIIGFRHEDIRNYKFNTDISKGDIGDLIYIPNDENYTVKYPYNFVYYRHKNSYEHPDGRSEIRELKQTILFKNIMLKIQSRYGRRCVLPSFAAIYESTLEGAEQTAQSEAIASELTNIENTSGIAIPNLKNLIVLSPTGGVDFEKTFDRLDKVITIKIQGTDLLTSTRTTTFASSKTGKELVEQTTKQIAVLLQRLKNKIFEIAANNRFGFNENKPRFQYDLTTKFDVETYRAMIEWGIEPDFDAFSKSFPVAKGYTRTKLGGFPVKLLSEETTKKLLAPTEDELEEDAERKQEEENDDLKQGE